MDVRIAAWNLNHRAGKGALGTQGVVDAILGSDPQAEPDVVVLNEYVPSDGHSELLRQLAKSGYRYVAMSPVGVAQNQILIGSRHKLVGEELLPVPGLTEAAITNWLHRRIPALQIEIIGMRVPWYGDERWTRYWSQVEAILRMGRHRPLVMIGDVNCNPFNSSKSAGASAFARLRAEGFNTIDPEGPFSYFRSEDGVSRIDHVLSSPSVTLKRARFIDRSCDWVLAGGKDALSDHALLSVVAETEDASIPAHE